MPKKDKVYTKLITAPIKPELFENFQKVQDATGMKKAEVLRSLCADNLPIITFTKSFWKQIGGRRFIKSDFTPEEILEDACYSLGIEKIEGMQVKIENETYPIHAGPGLGIAATLHIIQSLYDLTNEHEQNTNEP